MAPLFHRALTWALVGVAALAFLAVLAAYAMGSPLPLRTVVAPVYVLLGIAFVAVTLLRPGGTPLPVGADRWRWRAVWVLAALVAVAFLALLVFPPAALLPWAAFAGVAMALVVAVAIHAILFPPRPEPAPTPPPLVVHVPVTEPRPAPRPAGAIVYATSTGVVVERPRTTGPLNDYYVTMKGRKSTLAEVERLVDAMPPATARPDDDELLLALDRWGEIIEADP